MFLRIFILILGTVLLVQLLNFAALLMVPPPTPVVYSTSRIALVARLGRDPAGLLTTSITDRRPQPANDARDLRLGRLIAGELSLPTEAVVVEGHRYGPPVMVGVLVAAANGHAETAYAIRRRQRPVRAVRRLNP